MLRCLLIDDERAAIEILKIHLQKVPFLSLVGETTSAKEGLHILMIQKIDLVFLDIEMPEITGLELIAAIPAGTMVIITTAFPDYALDGYELNIVDYLLKPISFQRFMTSASKAHKLHSAFSSSKEDGFFQDDHIYAKAEHKGKLLKILFKEIVYVEGMKNYIAIHRKGEKIITLNSLTEMEKKLPPSHFMRIHKSFIVAIDEIEGIEGGEVLLRTGARIPFGVTYKEAFFEKIRNKML